MYPPSCLPVCIKGVQKFSFILDVSFIFEEINAEISIFKIIPLEIGSHDNVSLFSPKTVHVSFKSWFNRFLSRYLNLQWQTRWSNRGMRIYLDDDDALILRHSVYTRTCVYYSEMESRGRGRVYQKQWSTAGSLDRWLTAPPEQLLPGRGATSVWGWSMTLTMTSPTERSLVSRPAFFRSAPHIHEALLVYTKQELLFDGARRALWRLITAKYANRYIPANYTTGHRDVGTEEQRSIYSVDRST